MQNIESSVFNNYKCRNTFSNLPSVPRSRKLSSCESKINNIRVISNERSIHNKRSDSSNSNQFTIVREMPKNRKYDGSRGISQKLRVPLTKMYLGKGR